MKKDKGTSEEAAELRRSAEARLKEKQASQSSEVRAQRSEDETQRFLHELQVHQVELEMQNEELRLAREDIEAALTKYTDLYDFAPVGYLTLDRDGTILAVNLKGATLLGMERSLLMGRRFGPFVSAETRPVFNAFLGKVFEGKTRDICDVELLKGGKPLVFVRIEATASASGQECRAAVTDITERQRAEEEGKKLEFQLRQAQKMESIATLAGGIAHQFNNVLTVITVNLDLLEMDSGDKTIIDYVNPMKDAASRMAQLTGQLLAYARGGRYQAKTISLSDLVRNTLPLLQHTLKSSVFVETDLPHDVSSVRVDLTQMQMVLSAILSNSSEAIEKEGHVRISCRNEVVTEERAKDSPGLKPGPCVSLTIEDNGKGMDEATRSRVFEPFFTTKFQGRGLGMAAAYGIIKNHDGWISVESELGKGTTVRIYLPAILDAEEKGPKIPRIELIKGTGTILVIEDEEMVTDVSRASLERLGYRVLRAKTGKEAISIAGTFDGNIDLAILDVVLPDINGRALYPLLKKTLPNLKVIVCSGYSLDGPAQEILDMGAQGFVQKPFSMATLSEKVKDVLEAE
jgi:two-component system cell cycle sensor histidine kinase/response regulator CckA